MEMIALKKIRTLTLAAPSAKGRPAYISAASGLVRRGGFIYVIADDELDLGVFRKSATPGHLVRLFAGTLPTAAKARKKAKPDFETLAFIPAFDDYPHGALLAAGSGSRPNRTLGALIALDAKGAVRGAPRVVDLACIMTPLADKLDDLNIEGLVAHDGALIAFHRGNVRHRKSAVIHFPLEKVLRALCREDRKAVKPRGVRKLDLGAIGAVPLGFTDASVLPGGDMMFSAVAEDTEDAYADGLCAGAAIGRLSPDGTLRWIRTLDAGHKIEGISARIVGKHIHVVLATDADDITVPAGLFSATLPL